MPKAKPKANRTATVSPTEDTVRLKTVRAGSRRAAVALLAAATLVGLANASLFARITPAGQGPDEMGHVKYVRFIQRTGRLPDPSRDVAWRGEYPDLRQLELPSSPGYECGQPPLYYMFAAGLTSVAGPLSQTGIVVLLRAVNVALFGASIVFIGLALRRFLPVSSLSAVATFAYAVCPRAAVAGSTVTNDTLVLCLVAAAVWVLSGVSGSARPVLVALSAGVLLGLGALTKTTALVTLVWMLAYLRWASYETVGGTPTRDLRYRISGAAILGCVATAAWWYGGNLIRFGQLAMHVPTMTPGERFTAIGPIFLYDPGAAFWLLWWAFRNTLRDYIVPHAIVADARAPWLWIVNAAVLGALAVLGAIVEAVNRSRTGHDGKDRLGSLYRMLWVGIGLHILFVLYLVVAVDVGFGFGGRPIANAAWMGVTALLLPLWRCKHVARNVGSALLLGWLAFTSIALPVLYYAVIRPP